MKKWLSALLTLLSALGIAQAQPQGATATAATTNYLPLEKALLWEISGKGMKKPSYLFGTMHIACAEEIQMSERFTTLFNKTKQLVLEIDLTDMKAMLGVQAAMVLPAGKELKDYMTEEDYTFLRDFLRDSMQVPELMYKAMRPFFISSLIIPKMIDCSMGSWEMSLLAKANERKMKIGSLETIQDQMDAINSVSIEEQIKQMLDGFKDFQGSKADFAELIERYRLRDVSGLYELTTEDEMLGGDAEAAMLINRNRRWIPKMEAITRDKPAFFAVGAAHLGGEEGVIALLRKAGYEVKAVE